MRPEVLFILCTSKFSCKLIFFVSGLSRVLLGTEMSAEYSLNCKIWGSNFGVDKNVSYLG